ncbi:hypothetical protein [Brevundimonas sp.]
MNDTTIGSRPGPGHLTRRTRLLAKGPVLLIRVEVFRGETLHSAYLRLSTPTAGQTFTRLDVALKAFRIAARRRREAATVDMAA